MDIFREKMEAMRTTYNMCFAEGLKAASSNYMEFCQNVGSKEFSKIEFPFLESFAFMREWIGARKIKNFSSKKLVMEERSFEDTIAVKVRDIQTDNWGLYSPTAKAMGTSCAMLWDRLAADAIINPTKWIDDKDFFATDRTYGQATINNTMNGSLTAANFETAYATMQMYEAHNGEPLDVTPDLLIVGPENRAAAWEILELERVPDTNNSNITVSNRNYKLCKIQVNPRIRGKYKNYWFLAATGGPVKPVLIQKSVEGELVTLNAPEDENVFMRDEVIFGAKAYGSAACAFPHLLYRGGSIAE